MRNARISGPDVTGSKTGAWQRELARLYAPDRLLFSIDAELVDLDAAIADKKPGPVTRAYLCRGSPCSAPVETLADLVRTLKARVDD